MLSGGRHCRPGERRTGGSLARPGERRTENGEQNARQARDGWGVEKMDKPPNLDRLNVARLSQRPRRTTKIHKARRSLDHRGSQRNPQRFTEKVCRVLSQRTRRTTVQARSDKPSTAKGHKGDSTTLGRAGGGMAGFARHAWGEGALARPGGRFRRCRRFRRYRSARQARDGRRHCA